MLFSEMIKPENISEQNAFLLWMIYEWPIFVDWYRKVLAYSAYKFWAWPRSKEFMDHAYKNWDEYLNDHLIKLKSFLWDWYDVFFNSDINTEFDNSDNNKSIINSWVSTLIYFDLPILENVDIENYISWIIEKWLIDADEHYKNVFFIWAMDARWSLDFKLKFFSIDLAQRDFPEVARRKLYKFNDIIWAVFNYNPRLTQENSSKKNDQFRINLEYYIWRFWLFTPYKIDYYKYERWISLKSWNEEIFFKDRNYSWISLTSVLTDRNAKINELAIKLKQEWLTAEQKQSIINQYRIDYLIDDDDDEILHSSQNVKENAKIRDEYKCMIDESHITFNSKSNWMNYVEAHHLIPFSERNNYNLSIDIIENMVCLCPNCHRKIHLAVDEQKKELLNPLYKRKSQELSNAWIVLDIETLYHYYGIS